MSDAQQSVSPAIPEVAISNMPTTGLRGDYAHMGADYTTAQNWDG